MIAIVSEDSGTGLRVTPTKISQGNLLPVSSSCLIAISHEDLAGGSGRALLIKSRWSPGIPRTTHQIRVSLSVGEDDYYPVSRLRIDMVVEAGTIGTPQLGPMISDFDRVASRA